jgi:hypothetical protein
MHSKGRIRNRVGSAANSLAEKLPLLVVHPTFTIIVMKYQDCEENIFLGYLEAARAPLFA